MSDLKKKVKKKFDEIVELCDEVIPEYGEGASYFKEPATEEEIVAWEETTKVKIPESYREWLKLTSNCRMAGTIATYFFPKTVQPEFIPEDYVVIGYVVGDGEVMCFSKKEGNFITYFENEVNEEYEDFLDALKETERLIRGELPEISFTDEQIEMMLAKLEELKRKKGENK